jgi:hypothetical protein
LDFVVTDLDFVAPGLDFVVPYFGFVAPGFEPLFRPRIERAHFLTAPARYQVPYDGDVVTKVGALEPVRQVELERRRGQHDATARQGIDPVRERERLLD